MGKQAAAGYKKEEFTDKAAGLRAAAEAVRTNPGGLAQLGEHLPCKQGVESSNLLVSIAKIRDFRVGNNLNPSKGCDSNYFSRSYCDEYEGL